MSGLPEESSGADITVKFFTSWTELRVPTSAIVLPASLSRVALSAVIAHLLGRSDEEVPLDLEFTLHRDDLVGGSGAQRPLLRSTLGDYIASLGISQEATVSLDYMPTLTPPKPGPSTQGRDWVGALAATDRFVFAGTYDGNITVYPTSAGAGVSGKVSAVTEWAPLLDMAAHAGPVTGLSVLEGGAGRSTFRLASAGQDYTVRLWSGDVSETSGHSGTGSKATPKKSAAAPQPTVALALVAELTGPEAACGSVSLDPSGSRVACGDWSGNVFVWDASLPHAPGGSGSGAGDKSTKRARTGSVSDGSTSGGTTTTVSRAPQHALLAKHSQAVTSVAWVSSGSFASGSLDHSIRVWDCEEECRETAVIIAPKAVLALAASPLGSVLAAAHADHCIRLWDTRGRSSTADAASGSRVEAMRGTGVSSGTTWMSSVAWHPTSSHHVLSGNYDGVVELWDTRSLATPVFTVSKHSDKVLAVAWSGTHMMVSGGADKRVLSSVATQELS